MQRPGVNQLIWVGVLLSGSLLPSAGLQANASRLEQEQEGKAEYDLKATFVLSLLKFMEWPAGTFSGKNPTLRIGILGPDPFGQYIDRYQGKFLTVGSLRCRVDIVRFERPTDVKNCQVVFVAKGCEGTSGRLLGAIPSAACLTISDRGDFVDSSGMVQLLIKERRVRFEVHRGAVNKAKLVVRSRLLKMADRLVEE